MLMLQDDCVSAYYPTAKLSLAEFTYILLQLPDARRWKLPRVRHSIHQSLILMLLTDLRMGDAEEKETESEWA